MALRLTVRLGITGLVFWYLLTRIDAALVGRALARLSFLTVSTALLAIAIAVFTTLVRWRTLLLAYGARRCPSWPDSIRLYLISMFYNLLPGAVGGDVYRGYETRTLFADGSVTRSIGVVFIERVLGFLGLLLLTAASSVASAHSPPQVLPFAALGIVAATGALLTVALGRRVARYLPGRAARVLASLPVLARPLPFVLAVALSLLSQVALASAGHLLLRGLTARVSLLESLAVFPLGSLAAYFPLTFAGAGARDTALVVLLGKLGVEAADALATSITLLALTVSFGLVGGLLSLGSARADHKQVEQ